MIETSGSAQFVRLRDASRPLLNFQIDGKAFTGKEGDTLLSAMLLAGTVVRMSDIGDGFRAGLCLMAACQDCWVWLEGGDRVRACTTKVAAGMSVETTDPEIGR